MTHDKQSVRDKEQVRKTLKKGDSPQVIVIRRNIVVVYLEGKNEVESEFEQELPQSRLRSY